MCQNKGRTREKYGEDTCLEVVGPVVGDDVEAQPVVGHGLHLAGEQVHLGGLLALVGVVDVEEALAHLLWRKIITFF